MKDWRAAFAASGVLVSAALAVHYIAALESLIYLGPELQAEEYGWIAPASCTEVLAGMAVEWSLDSGCMGYVPNWSLYTAFMSVLVSLGLLAWIWWKPLRK